MTARMRVLITGASRGIGNALAIAHAARGDEVWACAREIAPMRDSWAQQPWGAKVHLLAMDVASTESVRAARAQCSTAALDVVINNAGINGGPQHAPGMDLAQTERVLAVNALGPTRVYDAFVDLLRASPGNARLVNIGSEAGSLGSFRASSKPDYAMSKAALNALTRWIAVQEKGVVCVSLDPGWTRTAMGGEGAPHTPQETALRIIAAVDRLTMEHTGRFLTPDLTDLVW